MNLSSFKQLIIQPVFSVMDCTSSLKCLLTPYKPTAELTMKRASDKLTMKAIKRAKNTYEKRYEKGRDKADRKRGKPPYSYISLIVLAILESPNRRQTLRGIIEYIQKRFPAYYGDNCPAKGWKNSIRNNLSLNDCFEKTYRDPNNPSNGHYWCLHPRSAHMFEGGSFMRRKKRFRKDSDRLKESVPTPHCDAPNTLTYDFNLTPFRDVSVTLFQSLSMTSSERKEGSKCSVLPTHQAAYPAPPWWIPAESFKEEDLSFKDSFSNVLLPPSSNNSICLVCAGCTCCY